MRLLIPPKDGSVYHRDPGIAVRADRDSLGRAREAEVHVFPAEIPEATIRLVMPMIHLVPSATTPMSRARAPYTVLPTKGVLSVDRRPEGLPRVLTWIIHESFDKPAKSHRHTERSRSVGITRLGRPSTPLRMTKPLWPYRLQGSIISL